jgi:4-amino-4-deoxy-L-arabinose transferase-like glycosyltransferase
VQQSAAVNEKAADARLLFFASAHARPSPLCRPCIFASVTPASPAIVPQSAVRRLPRLVLLMFCMAYVLPGFLGREPWKNADVGAFGVMLDMAQGQSSWWSPQMLGTPAEMSGLLPYWLGAFAIQSLPFVDPSLAARLPFALLLALTLVCTWYAVYCLARQESAQPVAFAFGGEAHPVDYARAMADAALLALVASLGLAQLSHETTPDVARLAMVSAILLAAARMALPGARQHWGAVALWGAGSLALVFSGAPWIALALGLGLLGGVWHSHRSNPANPVGMPLAVVLVLVLASLALGAWAQQVEWPMGLSLPLGYDAWRRWGRLLVWFTWPAWPLVLWTLWRWRQQWLSAHVALPLCAALVSVVNSALNPDFDRALLLALPATAALAAFALPTLGRSVSALIDWFTLVFFSGCALVIWVIWFAMQTGVPAKPAANVAKLAPGFVPEFSVWLLLPALLATLAWVWLVAWRVGRNRSALWKSLVLPAAGATLCWLLLTTLWLPLLDFGRSYGPVVRRIARMVPPGSPCVLVDGLGQAQIAALRHQAGLTLVRSGSGGDEAACEALVVNPDTMDTLDARIDLVHWAYKATVRRLNDKESLLLYQRVGR